MPTHSSSLLSDVVSVVLNRRGTVWHCLMVDAGGNVVWNAVARDAKAMRYVFEDLNDSFTPIPARPPAVEEAAAPANRESFQGANRIVSLEKFWKIYLQYLRASGKAEGTVRTYQLAYNKIIRDNRITRIDDLTLDRIEAWARDKIASGIRVGSVNFYVRNLKAALEWGVDNFHIRKNPLEAWELVGKKELPRQRNLSPEELRAVVMTEPNEEWRIRWTVYLYSGFRNQAEGALRWEWIDWENREIIFPVGKGGVNGRRRHIPLHPKLQTELSAWRNRKLDRRESAASGPVLRKLMPRTISLRLKEMCREAKVDPEGVNLFSIRHTYEKALNTSG
ncbi:MAG: site-specific integrase [Planctomycetota bacterium]|jgi:integrase|nr:site-specific integrase [Planctomycetota bacterium]